MDWNLFWSAFGAIGTTARAFLAAVSVIVALKPYKKRLTVKLGMKGYAGESSPEYSVECYSTGESVYLDTIGIYYKGKIIVDCPLVEPKLLEKNTVYSYIFDEQEIDALDYHIEQSRIKTFDIDVFDVQGKRYRSKMDVEWYQSLVQDRNRNAIIPPSAQK